MFEYGHRYLAVDRFVSYCRSLNVDFPRRKLEFCERERLLFPAARVEVPEGYVRYVFDVKHNPSNPYYGRPQYELPDKWMAIHRLLDSIDFPVPHKDNGVHVFDKRMGSRRYLATPCSQPFRDWSSYSTEAGRIADRVVEEPTARHYYHYWQVHQLAAIQKYMDYCCMKALADVCDAIAPGEHRLYIEMRLPKKRVADGDYLGMNKGYDALSFFIRWIRRKERDAFERGTQVDGGMRLSARQASALERASHQIAEDVCGRFGLSDDELLVFARQLLGLHDDYTREEKAKLVC